MVMHVTIREGFGDDVAVETSDNGVKILSGYDAINATINLDWSEARELAETILMTADAMSKEPKIEMEYLGNCATFVGSFIKCLRCGRIAAYHSREERYA